VTNLTNGNEGPFFPWKETVWAGVGEYLTESFKEKEAREENTRAVETNLTYGREAYSFRAHRAHELSVKEQG